MTHPSRLGRIPSPPDPRDHPLSRYVRALGEVRAERPAAYLPRRVGLPVYDQVGPSCTGNSNALGATIDQRLDLRRTITYDGEDLYRRAKAVDGIPNVEGTYPRIVLKLRNEQGILARGSSRPADIGRLDTIAAYAALNSVDEILSAIYLFGSVELGSTWHEEWDDPDPISGELPPGQTPVGGHDYRAVGYDIRGTVRTPSLLWQNSWGPGYGKTIAGTPGRAWLPISYIDFADFEAWRAIDLQTP